MNQKNKLLWALFIAIAVGAFCQASADAKTHNWKMFLYYPPQVEENFEGWCKDIKEKTQGGLDIKVFYDGEHPFKAADLAPAVKDRSCEIARVSSSYIGGLDPLMTAFELPMMAIDQKSHMYVAEHIRHKWWDPVLEKKWSQKMLMWTLYPGQSLHTKSRFLDSMQAMKGMKIRVYNKVTSDWVKVIGGSPVTIPIPEVYTAAQRGVIDGATLSMPLAYDSKWFEIFKYITVTNFVMPIEGVSVNLEAWNELPESYRKVVLDTAKDWQYKFWLRREMDLYKKSLLAQQEYGCKMTFIEPNLRKEITENCKKEVWPGWVKATGDEKKAWEFINECIKYRDEFVKMSKKDQSKWLADNGFPKEALVME